MKWAFPLVLGLAGGVLGALLAGALQPKPAPARVAPAAERPAAVAPDPAAEAERELLMRRVDDLERQVAALRAGGAGAEGPASAGPRRDGERTAAPGEGGAVAPEQAIQELVRALKGRKLTPDDTNRLFTWLSVRKERIGEVIEALRKEIEADPTNPELHVALATAYVADLTNNTLPGPQQGMVWMKAQGAYDAAIKLEPEHWMARFGKAFGTSMAPEFLGMRPEAIRQFEDLLEIQKRKAPEPHHAGTYFRLGTLYKDAGNVEKARELWNEGLRLFPDNEELKGTIEASTKR